MFARSFAALLIVCNLLGGCAFYPGFDPLPNPDLYYLQLGDVVGGVKCAMFEFFYEREYWEGGDANTFQTRRFELDHTQLASVELTLNATTSGTVNYSKLDLGALGFNNATSVISVGNSTLPYPSVSGTAKGSNIVDLTLSMAQTVETPDQVLRDPKTGKILTNKKGQTLSALATNFPYFDDPKYKAMRDRCMAPNENGVIVDYVGLKNWLMHLLNEEETSVWSGAPEVYLDQVVLTTSFEISANASVGVNRVLTLVPVVGVPTVGFIPDHSHQLKITLHGYKNTPSPVTATKDAVVAEAKNKANLIQQCQKDVGGACTDPKELLLEKIIQTQTTGAKKS
jgi:hypothetical protein